MKSLEKIKSVLSDLEITEEQKTALDEFFAELHESLQEKVRAEYAEEIELLQESLAEAESGPREGYISIEDAEKAFNLGMRDAEKAFELAMEDAERAFDLGMGDAELAFEAVQKDLIKEHSETMATAMEDLYESLLEKAKEQLYESTEFVNIQKVKALLAPSILEESNSVTLLSKVQKLQAQLEEVKTQKEAVERESIIESLIEELPSNEAKIVKKYISEATSIDEVYERYNLALSLFEAREEESKPSNSKSIYKESLNDDEEEDDEDEDLFGDDLFGDEDEDDDLFGESDESLLTEESLVTTRSKESKNGSNFSNIEEAIISSIFKKK